MHGFGQHENELIALLTRKKKEIETFARRFVKTEQVANLFGDISIEAGICMRTTTNLIDQPEWETTFKSIRDLDNRIKEHNIDFAEPEPISVVNLQKFKLNIMNLIVKTGDWNCDISVKSSHRITIFTFR